MSFKISDLLRFFGSALLLVVAISSAYSITDYSVLDAAVPYLLMVYLSIYLLGGVGRADIFDPYHLIGLLHFFYTASALLFVAGTGLTAHGDLVSISVAVKFVIITLISQYAIFAVGVFYFRCSLDSVFQLKREELSKSSSNKLVCILFVLVVEQLISGQLNIFNLSSYGDSVLDANLAKRETSTSGLIDFINIFCQTTLVTGAVWLIFGSRGFAPKKVFAYFVVFLVVARHFLSGDRANLVTTLAIVLISRHYLHKRFSILKAMPFGLIGYVFFNLISVARSSSKPVEMAFLVLDFISDRGMSAFSLDRSGELLAGANLIKLIDVIEVEGVRWGGIAFDSLGAFLPRFMFNRGGAFGNEVFVRDYYHDTYIAGGGHGYFLPMDGYWDFGIIGLVALIFLYTRFCVRVYYYFLSQNGRIPFVIFYAIFFSIFVLFCMRSGIYATVKQFFIYFAGPGFLYILLQIRISPRFSLNMNRVSRFD